MVHIEEKKLQYPDSTEELELNSEETLQELDPAVENASSTLAEPPVVISVDLEKTTGPGMNINYLLVVVSFKPNSIENRVIVESARDVLVQKKNELLELERELKLVNLLISSDEKVITGNRLTGYGETKKHALKELLSKITTTKYEIEMLSNRCKLYKGPDCDVPFELETVKGAIDYETIFVNVRLADDTAAKTCLEYFKLDSSLNNGVYFIKPFNDEDEFKVFCDMKNGGYTVFQRRIDGSVDFYKTMKEYAEGFGDPRTSYWLGLNRISKLSKLNPSILRVDLYHDTEKKNYYAEYSDFSIDPEKSDFTLHIGKYSGDAGDSLSYHNNRKFSTHDRDNDNYPENCAAKFQGAFWYGACHHSNLNGKYLKGKHESYGDGIEWKTITNDHYSLEKSTMSMKEQDNKQ